MTNHDAFIDTLAEDFRKYLRQYLEWNDSVKAREAAARASVRAAGGRILTTDHDHTDDCIETITYIDTDTNKAIGQEVYDYSIREDDPVSCTVEFHEADIHEDKLMDESKWFDGLCEDLHGFEGWAHENVDELMANFDAIRK